jgi:alcohol dehydrogenase (NADP+)
VISTPSYAATSPKSPLAPFLIERREPGPHELLIDVSYCGVCHSDIHQARNEWGDSVYPMVPGHEVVGKVSRVGEEVKKWKPGDVVGVSVFVDTCRKCDSCKRGEEQYCENMVSYTYNSLEQDRKTPTYGGYSTKITVDENYVLRIPAGISPERAAPLLCAGITTYSPLRYFGVKPGNRLAVVGLGGLGHMGVKFGKALGADVTVVSHSPAKRDDALRLGANGFISTQDSGALKSNTRAFDFILDTVSARHDYGSYLELLKTDGTMILVGLPDPSAIRPQSLVDRRRRLVGSSCGSIRQTQEMLDFSAKHGLSADVEMVKIQDINEAFERTLNGDVHYRFVIDLTSLRQNAS